MHHVRPDILSMEFARFIGAILKHFIGMEIRNRFTKMYIHRVYDEPDKVDHDTDDKLFIYLFIF